MYIVIWYIDDVKENSKNTEGGKFKVLQELEAALRRIKH